MVGLAACSSGDGGTGGNTNAGTANPGSTGATSQASSACLAAVDEFLKQYDELPTSLPASLTPLASPPAKSGSIIKIVAGPIAQDIATGKEVVEVAKKIGWDAKYITYDGTIEDLNKKWEQAIGEHPTAIMGAGVPAASISKPLADAAKAGIITELNSVTDAPNLKTGPSAINNGPESFADLGEINANLVLRDSGCNDAHIAVGTQPFPILKAETDKFTSTLTANCPGCKSTLVTIQTKDLNSASMTNAIVSAIQADPKIKYYYATTGAVADGVSAALRATGRTDIKIFGSLPDTQSIAGLKDRTNSWWVTQGTELDGWLEIDTVLRVQQSNQAVVENGNPYGVLTPDNVPADATEAPTYPTNYEALIKQLWHLDA